MSRILHVAARKRLALRATSSMRAMLVAGALLSSLAHAQSPTGSTTLAPRPATAVAPPPASDVAAPSVDNPLQPVGAGAPLPIAVPAPPRQGLRIDPFVETRVTWTNNANFNNAASEAKSDTIGEVRPGFNLRYDAARLHAAGTFALDAVGYANRSQVNRILPQGSIDASLEAVERRFFIDGGVRAYQTAENPFQARSLGTSTYNQYTTTQTRLSPHLEGELPRDVTYSARSDNTWTNSSGATINVPQGYFGRQALRADRRPMPFGASLQYEYDTTNYTGTGSPALTQQLARLVLDYALAYDFVVEARGGYEQDRFSVGKSEKAIYGAGLTWRPTERTNLSGYWEKHDYANVWEGQFSHRMPKLAFNLATSKLLTTYAERVFSLNGTGSVSGLLDAALTTRIPDSEERARTVRQIIDRQGLADNLSSPTDVASEGFQLVQNHTASVVLIGLRTTYALSGYWTKTTAIAGPDTIAGGSSLNNVQQGVALSASRQLSVLTSLNATLAWGRTRGIGALASNESRQKALQLEITRLLAARTSALIGFRRQLFDSTIVTSANESAVFAGLTHHF